MVIGCLGSKKNRIRAFFRENSTWFIRICFRLVLPNFLLFTTCSIVCLFHCFVPPGVGILCLIFCGLLSDFAGTLCTRELLRETKRKRNKDMSIDKAVGLTTADQSNRNSQFSEQALTLYHMFIFKQIA